MPPPAGSSSLGTQRGETVPAAARSVRNAVGRAQGSKASDSLLLVDQSEEYFMLRGNSCGAILLLTSLLFSPADSHGQTGGTIRGVVTLAGNGTPLHNAIVTIVQL